ncbi:MAG: cation transporter [Jatrophihabitantaceae bacterium]
MSEKTYLVAGMTCAHCVNAVTTEVGAVAGVETVHVELASGQVRVTGDGYSDADIRAAVDEAGYELTNT